MEFKSLKNIESSFRQIRLFGIVFLSLCAVITVWSVWSSYRFAERQREKIYVLDNGKSLMLIDRDGTVYALWAKMGTVVKPPTSTSDSTTQSQIGAYSNTETGLNGLAMFEAVVRQPGKFPNTDFGSITEESTPWVN